MYLKKNAKFLIVNADDLGLTKNINNGIIRAFREGVVTSASLLSVGAHFDEAVSLAKENLNLDIGIHLCLSEEKPILDKEKILSLVNKKGYFFESHESFVLNYICGKIKAVHIEMELDAQIKKVLESGLALTHIDSHGYIHMLPGVLAIVVRLAKRYGIKIIRCPYEKIGYYNFRLQRYGYFYLIRLFCVFARLNKEYRNFFKINYFFGLINSGSLGIESFRKAVLIFDSGIAELVCHPGASGEEIKIYKQWRYNWYQELKVLTSNEVKKIIEESNIELINFKDIL